MLFLKRGESDWEFFDGPDTQVLLSSTRCEIYEFVVTAPQLVEEKFIISQKDQPRCCNMLGLLLVEF